VAGVNKVKMGVDEALGKLGAVGRWQILCYIAISVTSRFPACFHMLAIIYIGKYSGLYNAALRCFMYIVCNFTLLVLLVSL